MHPPAVPAQLACLAGVYAIPLDQSIAMSITAPTPVPLPVLGYIGQSKPRAPLGCFAGSVPAVSRVSVSIAGFPNQTCGPSGSLVFTGLTNVSSIASLLLSGTFSLLSSAQNVAYKFRIFAWNKAGIGAPHYENTAVTPMAAGWKLIMVFDAGSEPACCDSLQCSGRQGATACGDGPLRGRLQRQLGRRLVHGDPWTARCHLHRLRRALRWVCRVACAVLMTMRGCLLFIAGTHVHTLAGYSASGTSSPVTVSGLAAGSYQFYVIANNADTVSKMSALSAVITLGALRSSPALAWLPSVLRRAVCRPCGVDCGSRHGGRCARFALTMQRIACGVLIVCCTSLMRRQRSGVRELGGPRRRRWRHFL